MGSLVEGTFTATGASGVVGEGPVFYRLNCSAYSSGTVEYTFGRLKLGINNPVSFFITGTFAATIDVQFTTTPNDASSWKDIPNETYTAPTAQTLAQ